MNNFCIQLIGIGLACFSLLPVYAQNNERLTVEEIVQLGLEHNFRLQAASADADEAEAAHRLAKAGRLPVVQGQASYMRLSNNVPNVDFTFPGMDTTYTLLPVELNQFYSEVSVRQLLFAGGRLNRQIKAAAHQAEAATLMEKQEQVGIAFEIRQAYWELYQAIVVNESVATALLMVEEHLRDVQNRVVEGTMLRTDLLNAEVRRSEVLLEQVETKNRVRVARLQLNRLIGQPLDLIVEPGEPEEPAPVILSRDDLVEQALQQRPGLNALLEQVRAQETEVNVTKSRRLPELSLVGRYIYARPNQYFFAAQDEFHGTWEAGVALQWDLWAGGQRSIEASRGRAQLRSTEAKLADIREQVKLEVAQYNLELERSSEAIKMATTNVQSAEEALRMARRQFDEGVVLSTQVLDAEYAFRKAQANYARAVADYKIAQAALLYAMGQIWDNE